jgi:hypothetical protein
MFFSIAQLRAVDDLRRQQVYRSGSEVQQRRRHACGQAEAKYTWEGSGGSAA